jgi:regulator of RNase E activity RraB
MPEQWDFYFTSIDDRPASISLDLGRAQTGPAREWPWLVCLRIPMRSPRPDGLSSSHEAPALNALEDALADAVAAACDGAQVGRLTWNGFRELFLYVRGVERLNDGIGAGLGRTRAYDVQVRTENDPDWRKYFEFLFPSREQMFWIHDRRVVDQLLAAGDQVEAPRPVDHYAYFGDQGARDRFLRAASALGFRARALPVDEKSARLGAHLVREDAVDIHHIHGVVSEVRQLAEECGGEYDGWGCPVAEQSP